MKNFKILFSSMSLMVVFGFCVYGCNRITEEDISVNGGKLTVEERNAIKTSILDRTSKWAEANSKRDVEGVLDLFVNSEELRHTENGVIFLSYSNLSDFVNGWYATTEEMKLVWEKRDVFPISLNAATMTGIFKYIAKQQSGDVWAGRNVFTGVFIRQDGKWRLIHGHESAVPTEEVEDQN